MLMDNDRTLMAVTMERQNNLLGDQKQRLTGNKEHEQARYIYTRERI
jgi:hypothetical protein